MKNSYVRDFPRSDSMEQASIANLLPVCTEQLNISYHSLYCVRRLKEIAFDANSAIVEAMCDIENQGNLNVFLNLCFLDFIVIYKNALSAVHLWDEVYSLRQGYLLIYEAIKTYNSHSKSLRELASKTSQTGLNNFYELSEKIKKFRKEYDYGKNIMDIRNNTIGHIENDPVRFFERISKFNEDKAINALKEFVSILVEMFRLSDYIFINYTKKVIADSSLHLATTNKYSAEIDKLLNLLDSKSMNELQHVC